jgi:hypothetical protein
MTPSILQGILVEETKNLFLNYRLKNVKKERVPLNIYPQYLPAKKEQNDIAHFPYLLVKVMDGESKDEETEDTCKIAFVVGIYDEDDKYQGYKDVMNIIEKIRQHLFRKRYFEQFELMYPFSWVIHEEDTYPFYFGGIETNWGIPKIIMEDEEGLI